MEAEDVFHASGVHHAAMLEERNRVLRERDSGARKSPKRRVERPLREFSPNF